MERNKQTYLELADTSKFYQYLYMSKDNKVVFNNGIAEIELSMNDHLHIMYRNLNYPELEPIPYDDMLFVSQLLGIIDILKKDTEHIIHKDCGFKSRWEEMMLEATAVGIPVKRGGSSL